MKIKLHDQIIVTAGKDKGKTGEVIKVLPKKMAVVVKGINLYKRHVKSREGIEGGILSLERPLSIAKVAYLDPKTNKPTRLGYELEGDTKNRITKKSKLKAVKAEKKDAVTSKKNKKQTKK